MQPRTEMSNTGWWCKAFLYFGWVIEFIYRAQLYNLFLEFESSSLYWMCIHYSMFRFSLRVLFTLLHHHSWPFYVDVSVFAYFWAFSLRFCLFIPVYGCCYGRLFYKLYCFKVATTTEHWMHPVPLASGKRRGAKHGLINPQRVREAERILYGIQLNPKVQWVEVIRFSLFSW